MIDLFHVVRLFELPIGMEELRLEAGEEGFRFVNKLVADWHSGSNRFARPGEVLLGAFRAADLIAVGGLNRDPYTQQDGIGRLRHLYVRGSARRSGVGTAIVRQLISHAESVFDLIRLRTETRAAAEFYAGLGFRSVREEAATHIMSLRQA